MKKLHHYLLALVAFGFVTDSCTNDFILTSPWKEIPVVYAILNPRDDNHYIRVEKAFLDPETNALLVAKIADSLYYRPDEVSVFLQKIGESTLYSLSRVDGNLEGLKRDTGIFADTPNWLYKIKNSDLPGGLRDEASYRLIIKRSNGKPDITAETKIPKKFLIVAPSLSNTPRIINFLTDNTTNFRWTHDDNSVLFNITLKMPYREQLPNGTVVVRDTFIWRVATNVLATLNGNGNTLYSVSGPEFFDQLAAHIKTPTDDGRARIFGATIEVKVEGGGKEIREYQLASEANSGLTGAEIVQTYTNMSEGFGIFTAKNVTIEGNFRFGDQTIKALNEYERTKTLNFKAQ